MCFIAMKVEYLLTCYWIQSSLRCQELPRNCFVPLVPVWRYTNSERVAELNNLLGKTDQIFLFLPIGAAFNLMWYPSCWRHLEFHFYLSIMHEVAEIRPRSARAPCKGTLITARTLICFHTHASLPLLHQSGCMMQSWDCQLTDCVITE